MALKLRPGLVYEEQTPTHLPKRKKRLKLPEFKLEIISVTEIFRSFIVSGLVLINLLLLGVAFVWFSILLSFIHPVELLDMYGVHPTQQTNITIDGTGEEIVDAPTLPEISEAVETE